MEFRKTTETMKMSSTGFLTSWPGHRGSKLWLWTYHSKSHHSDSRSSIYCMWDGLCATSYRTTGDADGRGGRIEDNDGTTNRRRTATG